MIENQDIGGSRLTKFGNAARLVLSAIRYLQSLERIKLPAGAGPSGEISANMRSVAGLDATLRIMRMLDSLSRCDASVSQCFTG